MPDYYESTLTKQRHLLLSEASDFVRNRDEILFCYEDINCRLKLEWADNSRKVKLFLSSDELNEILSVSQIYTSCKLFVIHMEAVVQSYSGKKVFNRSRRNLWEIPVKTEISNTFNKMKFATGDLRRVRLDVLATHYCFKTSRTPFFGIYFNDWVHRHF